MIKCGIYFTGVQFQGYFFSLCLIFIYQTVKHAGKKYLLNQIYSSGSFIADLLPTTVIRIKTLGSFTIQFQV